MSYLLNCDHGDCLIPKLIELIIIPLGRSEDMNDDRAKISQDPARIGSPFTMVRNNPLGFQRFIDFSPDSLDLALAVSTTNDKIISKRTQCPGI